jgi:hypothetical protein
MREDRFERSVRPNLVGSSAVGRGWAARPVAGARRAVNVEAAAKPRHRLRALLLLGLAALALAAATPARAITDGSADGNGHPNVGALVANFADGSSFPICSGTLISPTVFLTAGHCVFFSRQFGATGYSISFDSTLTFDAAGNIDNAIPAASFALDPDFGHDQGDFHDLAVLIFGSPISGIAPATLPGAGLLDQLAARGGLRGQRFTTVGYGAT